MRAKFPYAEGAFFASLPDRPDTERLSVGWAVPHPGHRPGLANPGSRLRERAFVVDAGSFIYISCHCGATPYEIADELNVGRDLLQPHAAEQHLMLTIQRRLREDSRDVVVRELLSGRGISVHQAMLWKISDAGLPSAEWAQESGVSRAA